MKSMSAIESASLLFKEMGGESYLYRCEFLVREVSQLKEGNFKIGKSTIGSPEGV